MCSPRGCLGRSKRRGGPRSSLVEVAGRVSTPRGPRIQTQNESGLGRFSPRPRELFTTLLTFICDGLRGPTYGTPPETFGYVGEKTRRCAFGTLGSNVRSQRSSGSTHRGVLQHIGWSYEELNEL